MYPTYLQALQFITYNNAPSQNGSLFKDLVNMAIATPRPKASDNGLGKRRTRPATPTQKVLGNGIGKRQTRPATPRSKASDNGMGKQRTRSATLRQKISDNGIGKRQTRPGFELYFLCLFF